MKLYGTEKWYGNKPNNPSKKQCLIIDLICDMGHEEYAHYSLDERFTSETAYHFIGEFLDELDERIKGVAVQDEEEDPHSLYVDIYLDDSYLYTVKNIYRETIYIDDKVNQYELINYEIIENYQNSSIYNAVDFSTFY